MTGPVRPTSPIPMPPGRDVSWNRSPYCVGGECVEVARDGDVALVRDSKLSDGSPVQRWSRELWDELVVAVQHNVDHAGIQEVGLLGRVVLGLEEQDHEPLRFTAGEWFAFRKGALDGEFDFDTLTPAPDRGVDTGADEAAVVTGQLPAACETGEGVDPPAPSPVSPMNGAPIGAPTVDAVLQLVKPEIDPWDTAEEYGLRWAREAVYKGIAMGWAANRAGDGEPAWRSGPLTQHVPATLNDFETSPAPVSVEAVGSSTRSAPTASGGEVAPTADGATEPADECSCAGCEKCCLCGAP